MVVTPIAGTGTRRNLPNSLALLLQLHCTLESPLWSCLDHSSRNANAPYLQWDPGICTLIQALGWCLHCWSKDSTLGMMCQRLILWIQWELLQRQLETQVEMEPTGLCTCEGECMYACVHVCLCAQLYIEHPLWSNHYIRCSTCVYVCVLTVALLNSIIMYSHQKGNWDFKRWNNLPDVSQAVSCRTKMWTHNIQP